jgi:2-iminobutanoate/2-iminopropanoate deaminase
MTDPIRIEAAGAPAAIGPYSQAIRAGDLVFTAGAGGIDPGSGRLVEGGVAAQAEQALRNLAAVLEAAGSGLDRLVKVTVFLADIADYGAVNDVYRRLVGEPFPARTAIAAAGLPAGMRVEIEAIGLVRDI